MCGFNRFLNIRKADSLTRHQYNKLSDFIITQNAECILMSSTSIVVPKRPVRATYRPAVLVSMDCLQLVEYVALSKVASPAPDEADVGGATQ